MSKAIGSTAWALVVYTRIKLSCPELSIVKIRLVIVQSYWYSSLVIDAFLLKLLKGTYSRMVLTRLFAGVCCNMCSAHLFKYMRVITSASDVTMVLHAWIWE